MIKKTQKTLILILLTIYSSFSYSQEINNENINQKIKQSKILFQHQKYFESTSILNQLNLIDNPDFDWNLGRNYEELKYLDQALLYFKKINPTFSFQKEVDRKIMNLELLIDRSQLLDEQAEIWHHQNYIYLSCQSWKNSLNLNFTPSVYYKLISCYQQTHQKDLYSKEIKNYHDQLKYQKNYSLKIKNFNMLNLDQEILSFETLLAEENLQNENIMVSQPWLAWSLAAGSLAMGGWSLWKSFEIIQLLNSSKPSDFDYHQKISIYQENLYINFLTWSATLLLGSGSFILFHY